MHTQIFRLSLTVAALLLVMTATSLAQAVCGDADQSGQVDIDDVVYLIAYIFSGGPEPCPYQNPTGFLIGHGPCRQPESTKTPNMAPNDQECIEWEYDGQGGLTFYHQNTAFNCCPDEILGIVSIYNNTITITEDETFEFEPCPCLCLYDLEFTFTDIAPGEYTIVIDAINVMPGDEIVHTINLSTEPSGQYCVERLDYPWGDW